MCLMDALCTHIEALRTSLMQQEVEAWCALSITAMTLAFRPAGVRRGEAAGAGESKYQGDEGARVGSEAEGKCRGDEGARVGNGNANRGDEGA